MINQLTFIHNLTKLQAQLHQQPSRATIAERMVQRFRQLGVTVSAPTFFGIKLIESTLVQRGQGQHHTFVLPQPQTLSQAA